MSRDTSRQAAGQGSRAVVLSMTTEKCQMTYGKSDFPFSISQFPFGRCKNCLDDNLPRAPASCRLPPAS